MNRILEKLDSYSYLLPIILSITALVYVQLGTKKKYLDRQLLYQSGKLVIGEVTGFKYNSLGGRYAYDEWGVYFKFKVQDDSYKLYDGYTYLDGRNSNINTDASKAIKNQKYLVLYDPNNPKKAIIRIDYPIKDSADFKKYVEEFEKQREGIIR